MDYVRINPSGNITLLVTDPVSRRDQSGIAKQLMQLDAGAEQVGFIEAAELHGAAVRLQMMGGEFCGNATMSLAAYLAGSDALADGEEKTYFLEVSGAEGIIPCRMRRSGENFIGTVPMPLPRAFGDVEIISGMQAPLVCFEGISHIIIPEGKITKGQAAEIIAPLCEKLDCDALGIMMLSDDEKQMRPLVYVRNTDSAVWENACGSGTAALGAWQAFRQQADVCLNVSQPCPDTSIGVFAGYADGKINRIEITGRVRIEEYASAQV